MSIEGMPDGWELVRIGQAMLGDHWLSSDGRIEKWEFETPSTLKNYIIVRKIEKPKHYRPFANAAEFEPHRDRWVKRSSKHDTPETMPAGCFRVSAYNDHHYWTNEGQYTSYEQAFSDGKCFDDGTPFGVESEVTS